VLLHDCVSSITLPPRSVRTIMEPRPLISRSPVSDSRCNLPRSPPCSRPADPREGRAQRCSGRKRCFVAFCPHWGADGQATDLRHQPTPVQPQEGCKGKLRGRGSLAHHKVGLDTLGWIRPPLTLTRGTGCLWDLWAPLRHLRAPSELCLLYDDGVQFIYRR